MKVKVLIRIRLALVKAKWRIEDIWAVRQEAVLGAVFSIVCPL